MGMRAPAWAVVSVLLAAPAAPRAGDAPSEKAQEIAFELKSFGGWPLVEAQAGGRKLLLLLDTCAEADFLDLGAARALGLKPEQGGTVQVQGIGAASARRVRLPELALGGVAFPGRPVFAVDLSSVRESLGIDLAGILGPSFFAGHEMTFDYGGKRIRLRPAGGAPFAPDPAGGARPPFKVPFRFSKPAFPPFGPVVEARYGEGAGEVRLRLLVDSGAMDEIALFPAAAKRLGLDKRPRTRVLGSEAFGVGGAGQQSGEYIVRGDGMRIGELDLGKPLVFVIDGTTGLEGLADGLLGCDFLKRYDVTIDLPRTRRPGAAADAPPVFDQEGEIRLFPRGWIEKAHSGLNLRIEGDRLVVASLMEGMAAHKAGIRLDEPVTEIAGRKGLTVREAMGLLSGAAGEEVEVVVERGGSPVRLKLAKKLPLTEETPR